MMQRDDKTSVSLNVQGGVDQLKTHIPTLHQAGWSRDSLKEFHVKKKKRALLWAFFESKLLKTALHPHGTHLLFCSQSCPNICCPCFSVSSAEYFQAGYEKMPLLKGIQMFLISPTKN